MEQRTDNGYAPDPTSPQTVVVGNASKKGGLWILIAVVVLLVAAVAGVVLLGKKTKPPVQTGVEPSPVGPTLKPPMPSPTGAIIEIYPWRDAATTLPQEPVPPTKTELDQEYQNIRKGIAARDFGAVRNYLSTERIWHVENPKRLAGGLLAGGSYFETVGESGEANFINAPYAILFDAPPQEAITATEVKKRDMGTRDDMVLVNKKTGITQHVHVTPWPYLVDLMYSINPNYPDKGTGQVTFVYDATKTTPNKWVFLGQNWVITYQDVTGEKGDKLPAGASVQNVNISDAGVCSPQQMEIAAGGAVRWGNITGMIYTINPSLAHWDSGYLYKDTYTRVFTKAGTYTYIVQQPPRDPSEFTTCTVVVK